MINEINKIRNNEPFISLNSCVRAKLKFKLQKNDCNIISANYFNRTAGMILYRKDRICLAE